MLASERIDSKAFMNGLAFQVFLYSILSTSQNNAKGASVALRFPDTLFSTLQSCASACLKRACSNTVQFCYSFAFSCIPIAQHRNMFCMQEPASSCCCRISYPLMRMHINQHGVLCILTNNHSVLKAIFVPQFFIVGYKRVNMH